MKIVSYLAALLLPAMLLAAAPAAAGTIPPAPALVARAYVLYDYTSNQVLVSQDGHFRLPPAGLTKMMTAYVVLSAIRNHQFQSSQKAYPSMAALRPNQDEASMYLDHNKAVSVDELLHGMIIHSADDAVRVLVDLVSGDESMFADQMNKQALALGMNNTHFTNATGRPDPGQYSTAYDLTLLSAALMRDFPEYYALYSQREYQYQDIAMFNSNRLLWNDPYIDGIKTGHYDDAGHSLAASAERNNRRLISVVLGAPTESLRDSESQKLLNYGFRNFETIVLYEKNQPVSSLRVWKGAARKVNVGFTDGLFLTVPKDSLPNFTAVMESSHPIIAPIAKGQQLAVLKLSLDGKPYAEFPMAALDNVQPSNMFARGWDALRLLFGKEQP